MSDFNIRFKQLRDRYVESLPQKRAVIDACWQALQINPDDVALYSQLRQQAHRLSGSGAGYGFEDISKAAQSIDKQISAWNLESTTVIHLSNDQFAELANNVKVLYVALNGIENPANTETITSVPIASSFSVRHRIALLEDDKDQALSLTVALADHGFEVLHVRRSSDLWILLSSERVDLIVLDYWLIGETAPEVAAMIKRESTLCHLTVVCLTAETDPSILRTARAAGCKLTLNKKTCTAELVQMFRSCISD